jgi:hypothetical protein
MEKSATYLLLLGSILAAAAGIAAFIYLFVRDINVFILILSPVILACYMIPAGLLFGMYKRRKRAHLPPEDTSG